MPNALFRLTTISSSYFGSGSAILGVLYRNKRVFFLSRENYTASARAIRNDER